MSAHPPLSEGDLNAHIAVKSYPPMPDYDPDDYDITNGIPLEALKPLKAKEPTAIDDVLMWFCGVVAIVALVTCLLFPSVP